MKKQRNYSQSKEQKSPKKINSETGLSSLLDPEFEKEVIKMLKELRKIINRNTHNFNKELKTIKRNQSELDNSVAEVKIHLESNEQQTK